MNGAEGCWFLGMDRRLTLGTIGQPAETACAGGEERAGCCGCLSGEMMANEHADTRTLTTMEYWPEGPTTEDTAGGQRRGHCTALHFQAPALPPTPRHHTTRSTFLDHSTYLHRRPSQFQPSKGRPHSSAIPIAPATTATITGARGTPTALAPATGTTVAVAVSV